MERDQVWDAYFARLKEILERQRPRILLVIDEKIREAALRYESDEETIQALTEATAGFLDERLWAYSLDSIDRFFETATRGITAAQVASVEQQTTWYDHQQEFEAINDSIEHGLNLMQSVEAIVDDLLSEFGAFPNKSIIETYPKKPEKNYVPDYVLALAMQQTIKEDQSK